MLRIKRVYEEPSGDDGYRVLADRLWPRGVTKERAALDMWLKEIAPSAGLRTWFGHRPERFAEFSHKYIDELSGNPAAVRALEELLEEKRDVTLLYAAKDPIINHAVVLQKFLEDRKKVRHQA